jgi:hypothetical protein
LRQRLGYLGPALGGGINAWNHYSFLRTMQDGLGTSALGSLGDAASATAIDTIWK